MALLVASAPGRGAGVASPSHTATIVVRGYDRDGASASGVYGLDETEDDIGVLVAPIGLPTSDVFPYAPNQVAYTNFYGDTPPPYYTAQDIADITSVTQAYGGGVPRYAMIIGKFARHVMERSGAQQVNILGVSMGGIVSRWLIEKDVEGLASSGKIARWIAIEGVVGGNYVASQGSGSLREFVIDLLGLEEIDVDHLSYSWIEDNLHSPAGETASPYFGQFPVFFWCPAQDNLNNGALTLASLEANDGVQLLRDMVFQDLAPQSMYLGLPPTRGFIHSNHETSKENLGIRAGVAADLLGRTRVTVTLSQVRISDPKELAFQGEGEYVFGLKVYSPVGAALVGSVAPVSDRRFEDRSMPLIRLDEDTTETVNVVWHDGMVLPGEDHLVIQTDVREVDFDAVYDVFENPGNPEDTLDNLNFEVSTLAPGTYHVGNADWSAVVTVSITVYPDYDPAPASAGDWTLYQ